MAQANVITYGADPTGVANSASAFTAAYSAGDPYVPNGTYKLAGTVTTVAGRTLTGESRDGVILRVAAGSSINVVFTTANALKFFSFTYDGNYQNTTGNGRFGDFANVSDFIFSDITFRNVKVGGMVTIYTSSAANYAYRHVFSNCTFDTVYNSALRLIGNVRNMVIRLCVFTAYNLAAVGQYANPNGHLYPAISIQGASSNGSVEDLEIDDCDFDNTASDEFAIEWVGANPYNLKRAHIHHCRFNAANTGAIPTLAGTGLSGAIDDSEIDHNTWINGSNTHRSGLELAGNDLRVHDNSISNGAIIFFAPTGGPSPVRNHVYNNTMRMDNSVLQLPGASALMIGGGVTSFYQDGLIAEGNDIYMDAGYYNSAILIGNVGVATLVRDIMIRQNKIESSMPHANMIRVTPLTNSGSVYIESNRLNGGGCGIQLDAASRGIKIWHNVIRSCTTGFIGTNDDSTTELKNNIVINCPTGISRHIHVVEDYNDFFGCTTNATYTGGSSSLGAHSITSDPLLDSNDYPAAGSPCNAHGINVGVAVGYDGYAFGSPPPIGAFQFHYELISAHRQLASPTGKVTLYVLDLTALGGSIYRFCSDTNELGGNVVWQGQTYTAIPLEADGFERSGKGTIARPRLRVANVSGAISALCRDYQDMIGAKLMRLRTFVRYLDSVNFSAGNQYAEPNAHYPDDIYFVDRKAMENRVFIEFELAPPWDVTGVKLPRRQYIQNVCTWRYRSAECGYAGGPVADINDVATSNPALDQCGLRLSSCRMRFGAAAELPYGGFPGVGLFR